MRNAQLRQVGLVVLATCSCLPAHGFTQRMLQARLTQSIREIRGLLDCKTHQIIGCCPEQRISVPLKITQTGHRQNTTANTTGTPLAPLEHQNHKQDTGHHEDTAGTAPKTLGPHRDNTETQRLGTPPTGHHQKDDRHTTKTPP